MKRRIEHEVWYRGFLVRSRMWGWRLRVTVIGAWLLTHPDGGLVICRPPRNRAACMTLIKEMHVQERAMRKGRQNWEDGEWVGSVRKSRERSRRGSEITTSVPKTVTYLRAVSCNDDATRSTATR